MGYGGGRADKSKQREHVKMRNFGHDRYFSMPVNILVMDNPWLRSLYLTYEALFSFI